MRLPLHACVCEPPAGGDLFIETTHPHTNLLPHRKVFSARARFCRHAQDTCDRARVENKKDNWEDRRYYKQVTHSVGLGTAQRSTLERSGVDSRGGREQSAGNGQRLICPR
jgi:hypothetical protein